MKKIIIPFYFCLTSLLYSQITNDILDSLIYENRTFDLTCKVTDPSGLPIEGIDIRVVQRDHDFWFGTAITSELGRAYTPAAFEDTLKTYFNSGVPEYSLQWAAVEPSKDSFDYEDADRIIEWLDENNFKRRGHSILWGSGNDPLVVQDWVKELNNQELMQQIRERVFDLLTRYKGAISEYDAINEILNAHYFTNRLGDSINDSVFVWAKQADPDVVLYLNEFDVLAGDEVDEYVDLINDLLNRGLPVGGIGIQSHFRISNASEGSSLFNEARLWEILETLAQFELPIKITEFDTNGPTENLQAEYLEVFYKTMFAHPVVEGILMWGFWFDEHWRPDAALFNHNFSPRPAALSYKNLVFNEWWTDSINFTNDIGQVSFRPFYGEHDIFVSIADSVIHTENLFFRRGDSSHYEITMEIPICQNKPPIISPAWRAQTEAEVMANRKGDVVISAVDQIGRPVSNLDIEIKQTHLDFEFGAGIPGNFTTLSEIEQRTFANIFLQNFNSALLEDALSWAIVEPSRNQPDFTKADSLLDWAETQNLSVTGLNLFDSAVNSFPEWITNLNDVELQDEIRQRVFDVLPKYSGRIDEFFLINNLLDDNYITSRLGDSIVDSLFSWASKANPNATLYLNQANIISTKKVDEYVNLLSSLLGRGVLVGGIGISISREISDTKCSYLLSPDEIKEALNALSVFGLPIKFNNISFSGDESEQAEAMEILFRTAFAHPSVKGIYIADFWERNASAPNAALLREDFSQKQAGMLITDLLSSQWRSNITVPTDENGEANANIFYGEYLLTSGRNDSVFSTEYIYYVQSSSEPLVITIEIPKCVDGPPQIDPAWKDVANAEIEKNRVGVVGIKVVDSLDKPVTNVDVKIDQTKIDFEFGSAIPIHFGALPNHEQGQFESIFKGNFNAAIHQDVLSWVFTEQSRDQLDFDKADSILGWAENNHIKMSGQNIFGSQEGELPLWAPALSDVELLEEMRERVFDTVNRFAGRIDEFYVFKDLLNDNYFVSRFGDAIVDSVFSWARTANPEVALFLNESNVLSGENLTAYSELINTLINGGIPVDGLGILVEREIESSACKHLITPDEILQSLNALAEFNLPIKFNDVTLSAQDAFQAVGIEVLLKTAFSHPAVKGVYFSCFWEIANPNPTAAIYRPDFIPRPAATIYDDLVNKTWITNSISTSGENGFAWFDAYKGEYLVTITYNDTAKITTNLIVNSEISDSVILKIELPDLIVSNPGTNNLPLRYRLYQNYPNPFNPSTIIKYAISEPGHVELTVYDILGREVRKLVDQEMDKGEYQVLFNGGALASGVYFYSLRVNNFEATKQFLLMK